LEIYPHFEEGLDGIVPGQIIVVLFWLLESARDRLKVLIRAEIG
jgi:tRNA (Thr-GGU) A37 N-methylase